MLINFKITIEGISPLLMHRFPEEPIPGFEKKSKEEQAEFATYRLDNKDPKSNLCIPGVVIFSALINGASYSKGKGRASLMKPAAACLSINPMKLDLGTVDYAIDARAVVMPSTRGRIMRYRPMLENWSVSFTLGADDVLISDKQLRTIVDDTGSRVGLLDFSPRSKGPFGRFIVTHWEKIKTDE